MPEKFKYIILLLICISGQIAFAQSPTNPNNPTYPGQQRKPNFNDTTTSKPETADQQLDSLRKKMDNKKDTVVFNSKFIRVTSEKLLRDSTQLFRLDTSLLNFENYSPLLQPRDPRISLGYTGEPQRSLLFSPSKTIGFDAGQHELDPYLLNPDDINYYRARVPLTILDFVTGGHKEQILKVTHTQNVNPQLNVGFNLNFTGSQGYYGSALLGQNVSNVNAAFFSWYESKNKRYNLLTNLIYNNLKSPITGSILSNDTIFVEKNPLATTDEISRLPNTYEQWTGSSFYLKQFYYIGRIDSLKKKGANSSILPTQRVAYTFFVESKKYNFRQNDADTYNVFPDYYFDSNYARDSLTVHHLQNSFSYSFYLRSKGDKPVKNEAKLDVGLTQDIYSYNQYVADTILNQYGAKINGRVKEQSNAFQDITLNGKISYRFSDRLLLEGNVQQIAVGRDFGNFLYDAKLTLAGGGKVGKIVFEGYTQSSAPPLVYTNWVSDHFIFHNKFNNQKTNSLSFNYINDALQFDLKAEYFLIGDYLYFEAQPNGIDAHPVQLGADINLLKVSLGKSLSYRHWHFDTYAVYQKTDYQSTLRTPEFYNYSSLYYKGMYFDVLNTSIGIDVRYNTAYVAPSYAPGLGQFYNGPNVTFSSFPVATVFLKATLQRTNFFIMYDYANQGLLSPGYYTVYKYPQQDHLLKFGVSWAFYN
ncbi:putative porin [Mucilaginibacter sp.]|uniref:putative porin n=1 Tax=Mucilaginibacter sp. TaxID=1882438 RepID=UPI002849F574|nr:putative porin [Mucilaginibacter sp.]MDR3694333.1 putative porin [Mucilaginibacter sp.]